jgi:hypothetical protein
MLWCSQVTKELHVVDVVGINAVTKQIKVQYFNNGSLIKHES